MNETLQTAFKRQFLGHAPKWYKLTIVAFLIINPLITYFISPTLAGWCLVIEFIFTLAMALQCYPLQSGGLLAIEALFIGLTDTATVVHELEGAFDVILLLIFMVAGIYFMKNLLLYAFTKLILNVRSKVILSLLFSFSAAFLSAFLDALTVTAVIISICIGFYSIYHKVASGKTFHQEDDHDHAEDDTVHELHREDLVSFRTFLRSLLMHAAVGTALGGVCTTVGEPQNLLIAAKTSWEFQEFFWRMAPVTLPVLVMGLLTCVGLELTGWFGYGEKLSPKVRTILEDFEDYQEQRRTPREKSNLIVQGLVGIWLILALSLQLAIPGLVGLSVIVLATSFCGIIDEHHLGEAFEEALPFTALIGVFFAIVAVISSQQLFTPIIASVLKMEGQAQILSFYFANGLLSAISDNVFVATIYIGELSQALMDGVIDRDQFDLLAVAINTGTNIPSVATPNGQAAFLFLLTSAIAPLVRLSYLKMVWMALPYTIVMTTAGAIAVALFLTPMTQTLYDKNLIEHHPVPTNVSTEPAPSH